MLSAGFSKKFTSACSVSSDSSPPPLGSASSSSCWLTSDPLWRPLRWPASPICSTRLVTVAMAWKRSVLQNWMNSRWWSDRGTLNLTAQVLTVENKKQQSHSN
uniref:Uncharacterized protein n=1 Tax=Myripristis murdjan TaxID=586833 RepID=A0A667WQW9_9TELE